VKLPAELLMGRRLRSCLPQTTDNIIPQWPHIKEFREIQGTAEERL